MKLIIIFMTAFLMHASASSFAQRITLKSNNITLRKAFSEVRKQTGYIVLIETELLNKTRPVKLDLTNVPLENALEKMLDGQNLEFSIKDKSIIVKEKEKPSIIQKIVDYFANIDVTGRVVDEKGEPIPGATIKVKGSNILAISDGEGKFVLKNVAEDAILEVISLGFKSKEVKSAKELGNIMLEVSIGNLDEVNVVSTGYQTLPKERVTGSFSKPSNEMFNSRISTDIISRLEGITTGLIFNRSNLGVPSLSIRGKSSISLTTDPLIVVDNFPYEGSIDNINPNDIANITLLKDAAAASIWGARSGNGVIVITTKTGLKNQKFSVDVTSNFTKSENPNLNYNRNFLPSSDFIAIEQTLFDKGFYDADLSNNISYLPISPVVELLARRRAGLIDANQASKQITDLANIDIRDQLEKYVYQPAFKKQFAVTGRGGNANSSHYFSVGYDNNIENLSGNVNNRITVNSRTSYTPFKNFEITLGINYVEGKTVNNTILNDLSVGGLTNYKDLYPYMQLADNAGTPLPITKDFRTSWIDADATGRLLNWKYIPLSDKNEFNKFTTQYDLRLIGGIKYKIVGGLEFEMQYQYQKSNSDNEANYSVNSYYARDLINRFTILNGSTTTNNIPIGGMLFLRNSKSLANNGRIQLNYNFLKGNHSVNAIGGVEIREIGRTGSGVNYYGYNDDIGKVSNVDYNTNFNLYPTGNSTIQNAGGITGTTNRFLSYFFNGSYTFLDKYTFSSSARIDKANLFGVKANQKSVPLWSAGLAWNISKENFYQVDWLPSLKIRSTYGFNGNLLMDGTAFPTAAYNSNSTAIQPPFARITSPGNPELTWERLAILNIGVDFALFSNRINGSIEYFHKKGNQMIGSEPLPTSTGFTTGIGNFSNIKGHGIDLQLRSTVLNQKFKWINTVILSHAKDEVTKYFGNNNNISSILIGRPVSSVYSYKFAGLDPTSGDPIGMIGNTASKDYNAIVRTLTIDQNYQGPSNPILSANLINSFQWKSFSLSFTMSLKSGYVFKRATINYQSLANNWSGNIDVLNRWQKPGDEMLTNIPSLIFPLGNPNRDIFFANSDAVIERGDHIRFQDASFGYDFKNKLNKIGISSLRLNVYLNNIGIIWRENKFKIDPDYQRNIYVNPKTFSIGLTAGL